VFRNSLGLIALLVCAPALAPGEDRLHLEDLISEALQRSPEVLAAQKRYEAARQRPAQVASLPDPMMSLGYTTSGSPRPFAGLGQAPMANAGVMVSQEFPFPGKRRLRGEIAAKEADADFQQYQAVQLSVASRMKQAFHRLSYAWTAREVLERNRDLLRKFLRVTEARYAVGKAQQQDIFKAQTQLSILETRVTFEDLLEQARENAPLLRREEKMVQRAELAVNLARKEFYPDYTLSAGVYYTGAMPSMYMARVDFKLPAWFWNKQRAGVAEEVSSLSQARRRLALWDSSDAQIEEVRRTGQPHKAVTLNSPVTGYVLARNAFPSQRITPETDLYTVADLSRVWVLASVFEYEAPLIRLGQPAVVSLPYAPGRTYRARVSYIQPEVEAATRKLQVRLELDNPSMSLNQLGKPIESSGFRNVERASRTACPTAGAPP
jgi:cobalt-zinc-cadmium efflux system outer membrane protein